MSNRAIKLLHVEDERYQRMILAHHLRAIDDLQFEVLYADTEDAALEAFDRGGVEFVIIDYQLRGGDGLHCLEQIRRRDQVVPIVAISGAATEEVADALVQAGADDFIPKRELDSQALARSMRAALARADAWRLREAMSRT